MAGYRLRSVKRSHVSILRSPAAVSGVHWQLNAHGGAFRCCRRRWACMPGVSWLLGLLGLDRLQHSMAGPAPNAHLTHLPAYPATPLQTGMLWNTEGG